MNKSRLQFGIGDRIGKGYNRMSAMNHFEIDLPALQITVRVQIERKKMKTCRLRVLKNGEVKLSVPKNTSSKWIEGFLLSKRDWLVKALQGIEAREAKEPARSRVVADGSVLLYLGKPLPVRVLYADRPMVVRELCGLTIYSPDLGNPERLQNYYDSWWQAELLWYLNALLDKWLPTFDAYGVKRPILKLRRMKTLWGSISLHRNTITFNRYLMETDPSCVEYVLVHELAHLIHPNHSKAYYAFLGNLMPDWKERKERLNQTVRIDR